MVVWKSGGCGGEAAKRAAKQEKETWDDKRAGAQEARGE